MKPTARWRLTLGLVVVAGFAGTGQIAVAGSSPTKLSFAIHVRNYAGVDSKTLAAAETVTSRIFQKAGVVSNWVDAPLASEDLSNASADQPSFGLSQICVDLLPREMSDRMNISAGVTGLAPGAGPDRLLAYVFYERVEDLARREIQRELATSEFFRGIMDPPATVEQILGEVIAHEIGHILLNLSVHTQTGIMRGHWDLHDLSDIAEGRLIFTKQQSEVIQAEVARRIQQDVLEAASRSETPAHVTQ